MSRSTTLYSATSVYQRSIIERLTHTCSYEKYWTNHVKTTSLSFPQDLRQNVPQNMCPPRVVCNGYGSYCHPLSSTSMFFVTQNLVLRSPGVRSMKTERFERSKIFYPYHYRGNVPITLLSHSTTGTFPNHILPHILPSHLLVVPGLVRPVQPVRTIKPERGFSWSLENPRGSPKVHCLPSLETERPSWETDIGPWPLLSVVRKRHYVYSVLVLETFLSHRPLPLATRVSSLTLHPKRLPSQTMNTYPLHPGREVYGSSVLCETKDRIRWSILYHGGLTLLLTVLLLTQTPCSVEFSTRNLCLTLPGHQLGSSHRSVSVGRLWTHKTSPRVHTHSV